MNFPTDTEFRTIPNNGVIESYTNACLWISIKVILECYGTEKSVRTLRNESRFPGRQHEMFDISKGHLGSLERSAQLNNLQVEIYYYNAKGNLGYIGAMAWRIGNGRRCPIVAFGGHFEPIVECPKYNIALNHQKLSDSYVPKVLIDTIYEPINLDDTITILQMQVAEEQNLLDGLIMEHSFLEEEERIFKSDRDQCRQEVRSIEDKIRGLRERFDKDTTEQQTYIDLQKFIFDEDEKENSYLRISELQASIDDVNREIEESVNKISHLSNKDKELTVKISVLSKRANYTKIRDKQADIYRLNMEILGHRKDQKEIKKAQRELEIKQYCSDICDLRSTKECLRTSGDRMGVREIDKRLSNLNKRLDDLLRK